MIDIIEMRGFKIHAFSDHPWELETPDGFCYIIAKHANQSNVGTAFAMFEQINHHYP